MNQKQRTQVVIIGAGPSGSVAAALLHQQQIDVIILEKVLSRVFQLVKAYCRLVWR